MNLILLPGEESASLDDEWELLGVQPQLWFRETNTRPLLVDAAHRSGDRGHWVLKPLSRLTRGESIKELVAYRLAERCGIPVPRYGVIQVSQHRVRTLPDPIREELQESLGPNFATRFMRGVTDLTDTLAVPISRRDMACDIFAFDVGVDNVDRRVGNSNLLLGDDGIFAIDHQHTFSLCNPGEDDAVGWDPAMLHRAVGDHFFANVWRRWLDGYARLRECGKEFDTTTAEELTDDIPTPWLTGGGYEYQMQIADFLASVFEQWNRILDRIESGTT